VINDRKIAATWSDTGKVHIWDLSRLLQAVNDSSVMAAYVRNQESPKSLFTFSGHMTEGKNQDVFFLFTNNIYPSIRFCYGLVTDCTR
jgi:hypothetical protein